MLCAFQSVDYESLLLRENFIITFLIYPFEIKVCKKKYCLHSSGKAAEQTIEKKSLPKSILSIGSQCNDGASCRTSSTSNISHQWIVVLESIIRVNLLPTMTTEIFKTSKIPKI